MAMRQAFITQCALTSTRTVGNRLVSAFSASKLMPMPNRIPTTASTAVSRSTTFTMYSLDAPMDFKMPISRVRSITAVYIAWKITMNPMMTATPITTSTVVENPGRFSGVIMESQS